MGEGCGRCAPPIHERVALGRSHPLRPCLPLDAQVDVGAHNASSPRHVRRDAEVAL